MKRAQELDPVSLAVQASVARVYRWSRRYDEAIEQSRAAFALGPSSTGAHLFAGLAYMLQANLGYTYALWGKRAEAQEMLQQLAALSKRGYLSAGDMAELYAGLRDKDRAFQWLAKAIEERDVDIVALKVDPLFDPIRPDPRFAALLRRVNLAP